MVEYDPQKMPDPRTPLEVVQDWGTQLAELQSQINAEEDEAKKAALQQQYADLDRRRLNLQLAIRNAQPETPAGEETPPVHPGSVPTAGAKDMGIQAVPTDAGAVAEPSAGMPRREPPAPSEEAPVTPPVEPVKKTRTVQIPDTLGAVGATGPSVVPLTTVQTTLGAPYPKTQLEARRKEVEEGIKSSTAAANRQKTAIQQQVKESEELANQQIAQSIRNIEQLTGERWNPETKSFEPVMEPAPKEPPVPQLSLGGSEAPMPDEPGMTAGATRKRSGYPLYQRPSGERFTVHPAWAGPLIRGDAEEISPERLDAEQAALAKARARHAEPPRMQPKVGYIEQMKQQFDEAQKHVKQAREELKNVDTGINWRSGLGMVMAGIADAARTLGSSIASQGRNIGPGAGGSYAARVADMHFKQQEAKVKQILQKQTLSEKERKFAWDAWNKFRLEKENEFLNIWKVKTAMLSGKLGMKGKAAAALEINKIDADQAELRRKLLTEQRDKEIAAMEKAAPTVTTQVGEKAVKTGAGEGAGKAPEKVKNEFGAMLDSVGQMRDLRKSYLKFQPYNFSAWGAMKDSGKYKGDLNRTVAAYVKSISGAQASEQERAFLRKTMAEGLGPGELSREVGMYKINRHIQEGAAKIARRLVAYPQLWSQVPADLRPLIYQQYKMMQAGGEPSRTALLGGVRRPSGAAPERTAAGAAGSAKGGFADLVKQHAGMIDPRVVAARIRLESGGNPRATAKAQQWKTGYGSEIGLLQLSPDTRKQYGITDEQAMDPKTNIRIGMDVWNKSSKSFFGGKPPEDPLTRNVWSWLVTAVGPGAAKRLRDLSGGYDLTSLLRTANDIETMNKSAGYWGSQSPALVSNRVRKAVRWVVKAMQNG